MKTTVHFSDVLARELNTRAEHGRDFGPTVRQSLERYFALLAQGRAALRGKLTREEKGLILDATNGVLHEPFGGHLFVAGIVDAMISDRLNVKWGVGQTPFREKLESLSEIEIAALADACERWWNRVASGEQPDVDELV